MVKKNNSKLTMSKKGRQRFPPEERRQMILEGAIEYYAEYGFDGRTREFADFIGISQSLIFRYFPTTEALVDSVYEVVFLNRWDSGWEKTIKDRSLPLCERLKVFYKNYNRRIDRYDSIRIATFSSLRGEKISARFFARLRERIILPIVFEIRDSLGLPGQGEIPLIDEEEQIVFSLHATVAYGIMRTHIFGLPPSDKPNFLIEIYVDSFMNSLKEVFDRIHALENAK